MSTNMGGSYGSTYGDEAVHSGAYLAHDVPDHTEIEILEFFHDSVLAFGLPADSQVVQARLFRFYGGDLS